MMNRANCDEAAYVPSIMSFVGLEGSNLKQHHLWDCWETNSHHPNTTTPSLPNTTNLLNHAFFAPAPTFLDSTAPPPPPPPLFPLNTSFPFYSAPQVAAEYPLGLIKREDGTAGGRIGLNLGHRTYFSSADAFAIDRLFGRSRSMYSLSHHQPPRCQAEGCKADLSGAKHYHRRHKVCEFHSKATVVIAAGLQQRFCQQCSRFHVLAEFDEAKRSCRKRLADHNRRRRKPQLPVATSESSSSKKCHSSKATTEKCKQIQKASWGNTTTKAITTTGCTSTNISTSISVEGHQSYQNKGNQLRNVAALSLGGVGPVEQVGMGSAAASVYQGGLVSLAQGKFSQRQQQQQKDNNTFSSAASNSTTFFHHHNLFSSNEVSQSTELGGSGHCTSQQHQGGLLHLGQAMFEVDFL